MVVNETMARTAFPGENPLGQTITTYRGDQILGVVVGVVADVRHSALEEASGPEMYLAMRQTQDYGAMQLVLGPRFLQTVWRKGSEPLSGRLIPICRYVIFKHFKSWSIKRFHRAALCSCS